MKKLFSFISLSCCLAVFAHAQSVGSLNIFSESGDKFYLFLDGKKQNEVAQANIRVQELPDLYYSARIIFKDSSIAPISKSNLYVSDGDDIMRDASYRIRREKGGKARLTFFSMNPVNQNYVPAAGVNVYYFGQPQSSEVITLVEKKIAPVETSQGGSLTVFSQNGEKFYLFLDGKKQNEVAQSNIRIQGLPELYYQARIVFKNPGIPPIIKNNLYVSDGDDVLMDASYRIRRDKAGKVKLNFYSMKPVQQNFVPPAGLYVYHYGSQAPDSISGISKSLPSAKNSGISTTPNTTANKTINLKSAAVKTADSKTIPTKKSAVENVAKANTNAKKANSIDSVTAKGAVKSVVADNKTTNQNKAVTVNKKCNGWPMGKTDLAAAKKAIEDAGKDESRLAAAKEIISSNCLMASQVTELCSLFKSEKWRLEFAKYAYSFTTDRKNYGEVSKAIASDPGRKELTKFISNNL